MLLLLVKKQMLIFTVAEPSAGRSVCLLCRVAVCIWLKSEKAKQFRKEVTLRRMLGKESHRFDSLPLLWLNRTNCRFCFQNHHLIKILSLVSHLYHSLDHNELYITSIFLSDL